MSSQKMVCHCSTAGEHDPKNLINMSTEPGTTPDNTKEVCAQVLRAIAMNYD